MTDRLLPPELGRIFADPSAYTDLAAWHEAARRLRREMPIGKVSLPEFQDFWAITRHADIMEIERHPEIFTNEPAPTLMARSRYEASIASGVNPTSAAVKTLVQMDGDEHRNHRNIVNDWFKPASVKRLGDSVDELAKQFVDRMAELGGQCDFANDIAKHYPLRVILSILGLPQDDHALMLRLTQELFGAEDPDIARVGEDPDIVGVLMDFVTYFKQLATDRRDCPTSDLASVIANAQIDGAPLPDIDTLGHYLIITTAGHDTTSSSIAGGLLALIEHPDQLALLQSEPDLIDHAVDELIRWVTPVKHFVRTCQAPYTVGDVAFQPGEVTLLSFQSANRDEEVFDDPFRLDVRRPNAAAHLAFGFGRHFCVGAHLARLEIRAFLHELLPRLESIELAGTPTFVRANFVSGPKAMPVRYSLR